MSQSFGTVIGYQEPRLHFFDPYTKSEADKAIALSSLSGVQPWKWQDLILRDWLAVDPIGKWVHSVCVLHVRRQQGKSQLLLMRILYGLIKGERILFTCHRADTVRDLFVALVALFDSQKNPDLHAYLVGEPRMANGQQEIRTNTGGHLWAGTRAGFGRGKQAIDLVIVDEFQDYSADEQSDLEPTTTMSSNPQVIYTGTPPKPSQKGEIARATRARVLVKKPERLCYAEWSPEVADDNAHLDDIEAYRQAAPSMGISNFTLDDMLTERGKYPDHTFESECLGIFRSATRNEVVPLDVFRALKDEASTPVSDLALAIDMNRDRTKATVSIAGLTADGQPHIEIIAHTGMRTPDGQHLDGISWVVPTVTKVLANSPDFKAVVIDYYSAARSLEDDLKREGVRVTNTQVVDVVTACGKFYDGVMNGSVHHLGQDALTTSLASAEKSPIRDAWKLVPSSSDSDITGIVSAVLALWACTTLQRVKRPSRRPREERKKQTPMFA